MKKLANNAEGIRALAAAPAAPQGVPEAYPCKIIEADFHARTVLLEMQGRYVVSAGPKMLIDAAAPAAPQAEPQQPEGLREALQQIADWRLPETGQFWDDDPSRPIHYEIQYGSNGARDYMRDVARTALAATPVREASAQPADAVESDVRKALHRILVLQGLHRDSPTYQRAIAAGRELLGLPPDADRAARADPTQVDAGASREYVLRAMSRNCTAGHVWDHLDADACAKGADEIKQLRAALAAQGDADRLDAARWREALVHVGGGRNPAGRQTFILPYLRPAKGAKLMKGSVAEHFTNAIDAAITRQGEKGGAA